MFYTTDIYFIVILCILFFILGIKIWQLIDLFRKEFKEKKMNNLSYKKIK